MSETDPMDVLVCATQVPFMRGGMEMLVENLVGALTEAGHRAAAVQVPAAWDRDRLLDAAVAWRMVPLDADLVITTNFPSYFARHPNKVAWLIHQHRAAYDGIGQPWSDFGLDDASLEVQRQLTDWDTQVLGEAVRRYSISGVVTDRLARYCGVDSAPLYHPPPLADRLRPGPFGDYVVGVSRLETNKRPGLVVDAVLAARSGVRGVMVGTGSLDAELRTRIGAAPGDAADRMALAGFIDDDALVDLLAGSLAVVYAPYDEDYGYVTLQAFLAGKPVVTTQDSGGVLEWVTDGETGLVTDGSPAALGAALDRLAADPDLARRLGEAGRRRAAALGWPHVVATLLGEPTP